WGDTRPITCSARMRRLSGGVLAADGRARLIRNTIRTAVMRAATIMASGASQAVTTLKTGKREKGNGKRLTKRAGLGLGTGERGKGTKKGSGDPYGPPPAEILHLVPVPYPFPAVFVRPFPFSGSQFPVSSVARGRIELPTRGFSVRCSTN